MIISKAANVILDMKTWIYLKRFDLSIEHVYTAYLIN